MQNLLLFVFLSFGGTGNRLFVADFTSRVDLNRSSIASWKSVFDGHGRLYHSGDTLVLITEKNIVFRTSVGDIKNSIQEAVSLMNSLGYKGIVLKNARYTSKFTYGYKNRNGNPDVGVIQTGNIPHSHVSSVEFARKEYSEQSVKETRLPDDGAEVAIMYNSNSSDWAALDTLHNIYAGDYVDLPFTNRISERITDLRTIKPRYIIVVADPHNLTPDFMYDADTTTRVIDADRYHDAVLSFVTGFSDDEASGVAHAPDGTNSSVLTIANPDGSLLTAGYTGIWLSNYLQNDNNLNGGERLYINTTSNSDPDITAINIADELNNLHRGNVFFDDHGWPSGWALRGYTGGRANDVIGGYYSDLKTWEDTDGDGYLDTPHEVNNDQNSFVFADACITARLSGSRETNWAPWESGSANMAVEPDNNIALAWLKDSPGFYIGSNSVSYGSPFLKFVLMAVSKGGASPAIALTIGKDYYNLIIGHETADNDASDGTTDDFLEYSRQEFVGLGKPTWHTSISANISPDISVWRDELQQEDQLPDNDRGLVYADSGLKWITTVNLSVNEELVHEMVDGASEDSMPFTYVFIKNVGGDGNSVWADGECALIGAAIAPGFVLPEDADSVDFAGGNPGDPNYHFYEHPWYGAGTSEAYEIFKADINYPREVLMLIAAGITDADNDGYPEWRINSGYSQNFDLYVFTPAVAQEIMDTVRLGDDHWRQDVILSNLNNLRTVREIIVKIPVNDSIASIDSVIPSERVHDVVVTSDDKGYNIEFTVSEIDSAEVDTFGVYYTISPSAVSEPIDSSYVRSFKLVAIPEANAVTINLSIPSESYGKVEIYDVTGRSLAVLHDGILTGGSHKFTWKPIGSGVYIVTAKFGNGRTVENKFIVLR